MNRWLGDITAAELDKISQRNRAARVRPIRAAKLVKAEPLPRILRPQRGHSIDYAVRLEQQCIALNILDCVREYRFHETRKWRIDLAFPDMKPPLAVEVDGAVHRIKARFHSDIEKHQALFFAGWRLLRVSTKQVRIGEAVRLIERTFHVKPSGSDH